MACCWYRRDELGRFLKRRLAASLRNEAIWRHTSGATLAGRLDWNLNTETLEVDNGAKDNEGSDQVGDVWKGIAEKSLRQSAALVRPGEQEMEESDDSTLEFRSSSSVNGGWRESLPDDALANVGGNEKRDTGTQSVALLEKLIEENNNKTGNDQLEDEKQADTSSEVAWESVKSSQNVDSCLSERENNSEQLLGGLVQFAVRLQVQVDIDHVGTGEKLEDHTGGDNWRDTQFHKSTTVTGHHHTEPVKRIRSV